MDREGTRDAYRLEVDLLPMVLEMRRRGIRIDQDAAEQARDLMLAKRDAALAELSAAARCARQHGRNRLAINGRRKSLMRTASRIRRTAKGNPSFTAGKPAGWRNMTTGCRS